MAFCGNCGASLTQATGFCGICGKPVGTPTPTNVTQPSAPQASAAAPGWTPIASQSSPGPSAASSGGWSPSPNQPQPSANWTPTPAAPAGTSQPSSQGWSSPAVAAPVAGWNTAGSQPAAPPAMVAAAGTGLTPNIAGALAYSLGIITGDALPCARALSPRSLCPFPRHAIDSLFRGRRCIQHPLEDHDWHPDVHQRLDRSHCLSDSDADLARTFRTLALPDVPGL